jgi:ACS family hexuronate transporter-like MFS transporter
VVGIGAFTGAAGSWLFQRGIGPVLDANGGNYTPIFMVCGSAYLVAWILIQLLSPKLDPVG